MLFVCMITLLQVAFLSSPFSDFECRRQPERQPAADQLAQDPVQPGGLAAQPLWLLHELMFSRSSALPALRAQPGRRQKMQREEERTRGHEGRTLCSRLGVSTERVAEASARGCGRSRHVLGENILDNPGTRLRRVWGRCLHAPLY